MYCKHYNLYNIIAWLESTVIQMTESTTTVLNNSNDAALKNTAVKKCCKNSPRRGKVADDTPPPAVPINIMEGALRSKTAVPIDNLETLGNLCLTVTDTGSGMTESELQQLFHEGVQFNRNKLQGGGGSGLGLCISKG